MLLSSSGVGTRKRSGKGAFVPSVAQQRKAARRRAARAAEVTADTEQGGTEDASDGGRAYFTYVFVTRPNYIYVVNMYIVKFISTCFIFTAPPPKKRRGRKAKKVPAAAAGSASSVATDAGPAPAAGE